MRIYQLVMVAAVVVVTATTVDANPLQLAFDAQPCQIVVEHFEGPRLLADVGRTAVCNALADENVVVPAGRWQLEMSESERGEPPHWSDADVDGVVDGWFDPAHTMTVTVRDATSGRMIDSVSVTMDRNGTLSADDARKLCSKLHILLLLLDRA